MTLWCGRRLQGDRNSGLAVARIRRGACAPRSLSVRTTSIEVGSNHCKSSKTRTSGCARAPAAPKRPLPPTACGEPHQAEGLASVQVNRNVDERRDQRRILRGVELDVRQRTDSSSASRRSGATSGPPNRARPQPRTGCSGVFCKSCDELHPIDECGVSPSCARNSSTSRDLPMPGSPTINTNCP